MRTMTVLPASMVPRSSRSSGLVMAPLLEMGDLWVERVLSLRETCRLRSLPAYLMDLGNPLNTYRILNGGIKIGLDEIDP